MLKPIISLQSLVRAAMALKISDLAKGSLMIFDGRSSCGKPHRLMDSICRSVTRFSMAIMLLGVGAHAEAGEEASPALQPSLGMLLVAEDFESGGWSEAFWVKNWCRFHYSCQVVPSPDGSGRSLRVRFRSSEVTANDRRTWGGELASRHSIPVNEQWIGLRIYFSREEFGVDSQPVILLQQHDVPDPGTSETYRNPILAITYLHGKLAANYRGSKEPVTPRAESGWVYSGKGGIDLGSPRFDQWNALVIHSRWDAIGSPTGEFKGLLEVWLNGTRVVLDGINIGFNDVNQPRLKFGHYYYDHSSDFPQRTTYFDDIKVVGGRGGFCDVVPIGSDMPSGLACHPGIPR
ncbi:MAG: heparin lyase I family protein [Candidatus Accumulibacter sp.]|jgi:hypothetical protein|uniref:Heparin lyase I family protein n=1 Tax=Candidatus Accumulibacter affinis TaxID=2954384 RepID=A0A935TAC1_9PROT|nr:heparin lyase I family protein [Candidatus Accumulibacter affinis]